METSLHTVNDDIIAVFRALGDPRRFAILLDLACREQAVRVSDLTECCGIDFSGVSRHLKTLKEAGLVTAKKQGRETLYSVNREAVGAILEEARERFQCC